MKFSSSSIFASIFTIAMLAFAGTLTSDAQSYRYAPRQLKSTKVMKKRTVKPRFSPSRLNVNCPKPTGIRLGQNAQTLEKHLYWDAVFQASAYEVEYRLMTETASSKKKTTEPTLNLGVNTPVNGMTSYEVKITCLCGTARSETITQVETVRDIQ